MLSVCYSKEAKSITSQIPSSNAHKTFIQSLDWIFSCCDHTMKPDKQHPVAMLSVAFSTWQNEATNQILHIAAHSSRDAELLSLGTPMLWILPWSSEVHSGLIPGCGLIGRLIFHLMERAMDELGLVRQPFMSIQNFHLQSMVPRSHCANYRIPCGDRQITSGDLLPKLWTC